jgi:hypothetical protein
MSETFWILSEEFGCGWYRWHLPCSLEDAKVLAHGGHLGDRLTAKRDEGRLLADFMGTTHVIVPVVSSRLRTVVEKAGLTGSCFTSLATTLPNVTDLAILGVTGRHGPIDWSRSDVLNDPEDVGVAYVQGMSLDPHKWSGDDFSIPEGSWELVLSDKAARAFTNAELRGIKLQSADDIALAVPLSRFKSRRP